MSEGSMTDTRKVHVRRTIVVEWTTDRADYEGFTDEELVACEQQPANTRGGWSIHDLSDSQITSSETVVTIK